jgi:hypothetical protein
MAKVDLTMRAVDLEAQLRQRDKLLAILQNHVTVDVPLQSREALARVPVDERVKILEQQV